MRPSIREAILIAASAASAACQTCPTTEVVRDDAKEVPTERACSVLNGSVPLERSCAVLCDDSYDLCFVDDGYLRLWNEGPSITTSTCLPSPDPRGVVKVHCQERETHNEVTFEGCSVEGRRPERLVAALAVEDASSLAAYFTSVAYLEAAAVLAFEHMIVELAAHGAPNDLVSSAKRARRDEIRHTRATSRLALRFGGSIVRAQMEPTPVRSLFAIALENEIEGVVRETLGAALATWRSMNAADPDVRSIMRGIAADERAHADLSWRLGEWLRAQLDDEERDRLDVARASAIEELRTTFTTDPAEEVRRLAGAPRAEDVQRLVACLEHALWTALPAAA